MHAQRRFAGRVAIVTGAGRGIGRAIAHRFLEEGAAVVIAEADAAAARDAAAEYAALGRIEAVETDVSDEASVRRMVERTVATLGGVDLLVNNAAIADPISGAIEDLDREVWDRYLATNLTSIFLTTKHAAPHLRTRSGIIINIASTRAMQSEPNTEAYAATKGGVVALTHALAVSLGPAIRVNCISPGWIATSAWKPRAARSQPELRPIDHEQHPAGRVGQPDDIASACAWLASAEASFVTGAHLVLDGGMTRRMLYAD